MILVRPAEAKDAAGVKEIIREHDLSYPSQKMAGFWVAEENKKVVGIAHLEEFPDFLFLSSVGVRQGSQHRGVATHLLEKIIGPAQKDIYLYTVIPGFFTRFGFLPAGGRPELPKRQTFACHECTPETCVTMVRKK